MASISTKNQEAISQAYLSATVAKANCILNISPRDEDSIDGDIRGNVKINNGLLVKSSIYFQLKSVFSKSNFSFNNDGDIVYVLKAKNYKDLVADSTHSMYLILLLLPENMDDWVTISLENLIIKKRMYFLKMTGMKSSNNAESVSVVVPKSNILNDETVIEILKNEYKGKGQQNE